MTAWIRAMSDADKRRLVLIATRLSRAAGWTTAQDLLHSAFVAAMTGDRNCPTNVAPINFLFGAMRGILFNERRHQGLGPAYEDLEDPANEHLLSVDVDPAKNAEHLSEILEVGRKMDAELGDERAFVMLEARTEGLTRAEIRDLLDMDQTSFESLETRVRRFMARNYPGRRK